MIKYVPLRDAENINKNLLINFINKLVSLCFLEGAPSPHGDGLSAQIAGPGFSIFRRLARRLLRLLPHKVELLQVEHHVVVAADDFLVVFGDLVDVRLELGLEVLLNSPDVVVAQVGGNRGADYAQKSADDCANDAPLTCV